MAQATVTSKGQITIPKAVRDSLHLHSGDRIEFIVRGENEAVVKPMTKSVAQVFGTLHKPGMSRKTLRQMNEAVARALKERTR